jgi:hypothetical protein
VNVYLWIVLAVVAWCGLACFAGLMLGPVIFFGTQTLATSSPGRLDFAADVELESALVASGRASRRT